MHGCKRAANDRKRYAAAWLGPGAAWLSAVCTLLQLTATATATANGNSNNKSQHTCRMSNLMLFSSNFSTLVTCMRLVSSLMQFSGRNATAIVGGVQCCRCAAPLLRGNCIRLRGYHFGLLSMAKGHSVRTVLQCCSAGAGCYSKDIRTQSRTHTLIHTHTYPHSNNSRLTNGIIFV